MLMSPQENEKSVCNEPVTTPRLKGERSKSNVSLSALFWSLIGIVLLILAVVISNVAFIVLGGIALCIGLRVLLARKTKSVFAISTVGNEQEVIPEWKNLDVPMTNEINIIQPPVIKKRVYEEVNKPTYWDIANTILSQYHIRIVTDGNKYSTAHFMQAIFSPHDEDCLEVTSLTTSTKVSLLDRFKGVEPKIVKTTYVWYLTKCVATILEESEISRKELTIYHPDLQFTKQQLNHELQQGTGK